MTDTLADSRTSSRMFTEGVPLVVEDVTGRPEAERAEMLADPGFGRYFTDHMFVARYRAGEGWYDARLTAYGPLQLDPATAALHYAQSIFEGLKAYAQPDGSVATFRPEANAARFARGAKRLAMIRNRYSCAGRTPRNGSLAIWYGRMYRVWSAPVGTQSRSASTSASTAARKDSSGTGGMASRLALRANRAALDSGRKVATLPSGCA